MVDGRGGLRPDAGAQVLPGLADAQPQEQRRAERPLRRQRQLPARRVRTTVLAILVFTFDMVS